MGCTQTEIAKAVGIDVSSVNKILNRVPGPVFRAETIAMVFDTAREMGYDFNRGRAGMAKSALRELLQGGHVNGVSEAKLRRYRRIAGC